MIQQSGQVIRLISSQWPIVLCHVGIEQSQFESRAKRRSQSLDPRESVQDLDDSPRSHGKCYENQLCTPPQLQVTSLVIASSYNQIFLNYFAYRFTVEYEPSCNCVRDISRWQLFIFTSFFPFNQRGKVKIIVL
jgi:hypothetical protein